VKLDPKLALGYQYLGFAEYQDKKHAEALADFTRAIELNPKNALTRFLRAYLTSTQGGAVGDDAQMQEDLRTAIAVSPEFAPPYGVLAVYMANQGDNLPAALKLAQKAQALEPGSTIYQIDLAQVLARMNRYKEARNIAVHARINASNPMERAEAESFLNFLQQQERYSDGESESAEPVAVQRSSAASSASGSSSGSAASSPSDTQNSAQTEVVGDDASNAATLREATGTVTKLSCMNGLRFELDTGAATLSLRVRPGAQYHIKVTTRPTRPFNPCTAIQGQRVKVEYRPVGGDGKTGEVESLTVATVASGEGDGGSAGNSGGERRLSVEGAHAEAVKTSAEGEVTQVLCNGHELTLNLDTGDGAYILHARDTTRVRFEQDVAFDAGNFEPCTQLKGRAVKIAFVTVEGKTYDGEIQGVEVLK
jgi:hypothetical protein